jgi:hypothetical protein
MFKNGQRVMISRLHATGSDGPGTILRISSERQFTDCWVVRIEELGLDMFIHPDRITDEKEYWINKKGESR